MNNKFDIAYLRKYVNHELNSTEMYAIEKATQEDELLMDIVLGLEEEKKANSAFEVADIDSSIYNRTHQNKLNLSNRNTYLAIAASLFVLLGIGAIWFLNSENKVKPKMVDSFANQKPEAQTDTTLNTIELDSVNVESPEENLIAMVEGKKQNPNDNQRLKGARKNNSNQNLKRNKIENSEISLNPNIFYKEIPKADSIFKLNNLEIASSGNIEKNELENSSVIVIASNKKPILLNRGNASQAIAQNKKSVATGRILDLASGRPIVNASVKNIKNNEVVVTDSLGQYIMPVTEDTQILQALSIGYKPKSFIASNNKIIQLQSDYNSLDEVVVVGYGNNSKFYRSEPLIGWVAYKKYINDHSEQSLLGKGNVILVFDVSTFGRPMDITVKKSANTTLDQKAIQIIQNGPDWKKGNDGKKIEVKITFK